MTREELEEHIADMFRDGTIEVEVHPRRDSGVYLSVKVNHEPVLEWEG
ncbi:hypothetical protein [Bacillus haynesii]|nr:hypothetical protein [Bacillus haynesii]MCY9324058.1 hypothetical protein [Bacillus haynesii]